MMAAKANRGELKRDRLTSRPGGLKTNHSSQDRSLAGRKALGWGTHFNRISIGFLSVLLFVKNAPLAWAGLSEKVEGPQRGGHSPALLAPAQTTHGDCVCLARPGDQAL